MSQSLRDEMDFRALVGDVKPLPQRNRADTGPQRQRPSEAQLARRESVAERLDERNFYRTTLLICCPRLILLSFAERVFNKGSSIN